MATIKTAIALYDGVTSPLKSMHKAMNIVINSFETMQHSSGRAVDTRTIQDAREELTRAGDAFDSIEQNIRDADNQQQRFNHSIHNGTTAADGLWGKLKGIAVTLGGIAGIKTVLDISDQFTSTNARLNNAILNFDDGGSLAELERKVMASAQRSRSYYMDTASAVAKLGLNAKDAFGSMDEVIGFSELINKQFVIGGASAQEQSAAMLQLTQAMASGVLRGDELRSVFEQAPGIIQNIADYLDVPIGKIRGMAAEGEITADIVKNATFAAADQIETKFNSMPKTWGQIWTLMKNKALEIFAPILQTINDIVNSEQFNTVVNSLLNGLSIIASVIGTIFEVAAGVANYIATNWSTLAPIFWGAAIAAGVYAVALGVQAITTWIANGAAQSFFSTLLKNPLFWIVLAIGFVVAAIYKWVQSVGGIKVAWLIACNAILTAWDWVKIGFMTGVYWVMDLWNKLQLCFARVSTKIQNFMGDMKAGVLMLLQNLVNGAVDILNKFIGVLNKIPGVNIGLIDHVTFGTTAQLENEAAKQAREDDLAAYQAEIEAQMRERDTVLDAMKQDAKAAEVQRLDEISAARENANRESKDNSESNPWEGLEDSGNNLDGIYGNTGDTAANTAGMADALDYAEEDLKYLRDIAEREAINRFTTAEIQIEQHNENHFERDTDLDGIMDAWVADFAEKLNVSEEGVHT